MTTFSTYHGSRIQVLLALNMYSPERLFKSKEPGFQKQIRELLRNYVQNELEITEILDQFLLLKFPPKYY